MLLPQLHAAFGCGHDYCKDGCDSFSAILQSLREIYSSVADDEMTMVFEAAEAELRAEVARLGGVG
jgi:hypothetical protein